jgi:DNA replication protein DnaT
MAGDWIKLENVTPDKPEIIAMAEILGIDQDAVLGKLVRLWIWADEQTFAGYAECDGVSVTEKFIDRCSCVTGFAQAMQRVGWLVLIKGGLAFPNFDRHNGQTAKARGLTAKRMKKMRDARSVTIASRNASPENREEKRVINPPNPPLEKGGTPVVVNGRKTRRPPKQPLSEIVRAELAKQSEEPK